MDDASYDCKGTMDDESNSSQSPLSKRPKSQKSQTALEVNALPIQRNDSSMFDDEFLLMKQRFAKEMRKIEEEMTRFSTDLVCLTGETTALQSGITSSEKNKENAPTNWEVITKSPLVEREGDERILKLQFDVSQFQPDEVKVKILNNFILVTAIHQEKTDYSTISNEFNREFHLPEGADPETVDPSIDKDGVLTIKVPLKNKEINKLKLNSE